MSDMPERIWITKEESVIGLQRSFRASNLDHGEGWPQYHRADAPLTPADAMARCPEVAALVRDATLVRYGADLPPQTVRLLDAALAPFTKGSG